MPIPTPATVDAGELLHASLIPAFLGVWAPPLSSREHGNLLLPSSPSPSSELGRARASRDEFEPSLFVAPAEARHPASIHRAPSCATSPRSSSIPPRARPSPYPGRIEHRRHPPSLFPSSFAIAVELLSPAILRPKSTHGEPNCGLLLLPDLFPTRIGAAAVESKLRRRGTRRPSPAHAVGPPRASPCAAATLPRAA